MIDILKITIIILAYWHIIGLYFSLFEKRTDNIKNHCIELSFIG